MTHVVVIYQSGYGHTQRMAQAVAEGAGDSRGAAYPKRLGVHKSIGDVNSGTINQIIQRFLS